MNILLMVIMMGLAMVFFHDGGHHQPSPSPGHHATKPDEAAPPSSEASGAVRRPAEPGHGPDADPKATREAAPESPTPKAD